MYFYKQTMEGKQCIMESSFTTYLCVEQITYKQSQFTRPWNSLAVSMETNTEGVTHVSITCMCYVSCDFNSHGSIFHLRSSSATYFSSVLYFYWYIFWSKDKRWKNPTKKIWVFVSSLILARILLSDCSGETQKYFTETVENAATCNFSENTKRKIYVVPP